MDEARMRILQMVADGALSAEEAARLLDALPGSGTPVTDTPVEGTTAATGDGGLEHRLARSFSVDPGGRLVVEADRGSIEVHSAETQTLDVEVIRTASAQDPAEAQALFRMVDLDFDQQGNDVSIRARVQNEERRLRVRFVVTVPRRYNLDLKTAGGHIEIDDLEGEVRSRTAGGSVHIGHIQGPVWGKTSGGDIALAGCVGTADLKTSGGSIRVGAVDGDVVASTSGGSITIQRVTGRTVANTSGGSITVDEALNTIQAVTSGGSVTAHLARQPADHCRLETSGGNVAVYLSEAVGLDVHARTSGGQVVTDFPVTVQGELRKTALQAKVNGGGPELIARTSGGSVYLRKQ